ncbi:MAG: carbohydrate-binding domain-containing protein, partial [Bacteroidales bacterium]|nr:carbohydrate-binding domain-containing protein [Bacteroidales bacterium]
MRKNTLYILLSILLLTFVYSCEKQENGFEIIEGGVYSSGSFHDRSTDYQWDKTKIVDIAFNDRTISVSPENITIRENTVIIDKAGTYRLSGTLTDGQIIVDTDDSDIVTLLLNGVDVLCSNGSPLIIEKASKTIIYLEKGTVNSFVDVFSDLSSNKSTASVYSNSYLTFFGEGTLDVKGQNGDGISSEKGLLIKSGKFVISAIDDGIVGKEYLVIDGGDFTINSGDDGVCCGGDLDEIRDDHEGVISGADFSLYIQGGYLFVNSGGYGINAKRSIEMKDGEVVISGPTEPDKGAIEYDDSFVITGGTLIAVGNGNKEKPYTTSLSSQYGVYAFLSNN